MAVLLECHLADQRADLKVESLVGHWAACSAGQKVDWMAAWRECLLAGQMAALKAAP
jgi:hypothetical protein